jgi:hypothetical protein
MVLDSLNAVWKHDVAILPGAGRGPAANNFPIEKDMHEELKAGNVTLETL